jgi:hydroxyquinol 1,2-dioxygenase
MRNLSLENVTPALENVFDQTPNPRLKQIMCALVRHLHGFAREVQLTEEEWTYAMNFLVRAGQISDEKRNEFIMFSDILGLSAVVDLISHGNGMLETPASQLGPFFVDNLPVAESHIVDLRQDNPGEPVLFTGTVIDGDGKPICGAIVDEWQTDGDGLYDVQLTELKGPRFRCRLRVDENGQFVLKTVRPRGYTAPMDGPGGEMLAATRRNIWRPSHFHFRIRATGYATIVTELFPEGDEHLDNDVAFGVRAPLILNLPKCTSVEVGKKVGMPVPFTNIEYTFRMRRRSS